MFVCLFDTTATGEEWCCLLFPRGGKSGFPMQGMLTTEQGVGGSSSLHAAEPGGSSSPCVVSTDNACIGEYGLVIAQW